jgi:hypothetical protein
MTDDKFWLLHISSPDDQSPLPEVACLYHTEAAARSAVIAYAREHIYWDTDEELVPDADDDLLDRFFDEDDLVSYEITEVSVKG